MFVPETITSNVLAVYHAKSPINPKKILVSEDLKKWCDNQVKTLKKLCLDTIITHWEKIQVINEFALDEDARYVLDNLPHDLPFKLAIFSIHDDMYWRRAFRTRWPGKMLPVKPVKLDYDIPNQFKRRTAKHTPQTIEDEDNIVKINTWKCFYIERHLQNVLEHLKPEDYNPEEMKELIELSRDYIIRLKLNQLQAPAEHDKERIPLQVILPALINLKQLNVCFKQTSVENDFSWHILQTTQKDMNNLAKGLQNCDLHVLRIINTDITCDKVTMIACHLCANQTLRVLDFSHCKIGDKGMIALCKLLLELPSLKDLNIMNNFIEFKGLELLCYTLSKPSVELRQLDLNLNNFGGSDGGLCANVLARMLAENSQLVRLNLASCGLNSNDCKLLIDALRTNASLLHLDLSNNGFDEEIGNLFITLLKSSNLTLKTVDLRMTWIPSTTVLFIDDLLDDPQRNSRKHVKKVEKSETNESKEENKSVTHESHSHNVAKCNGFPHFLNVDELEAQLESVFQLYMSTMNKDESIQHQQIDNIEEIDEHEGDQQQQEGEIDTQATHEADENEQNSE